MELASAPPADFLSPRYPHILKRLVWGLDIINGVRA
jgi:hypothetical protein